MYDLQADPDERKNIAGDAGYAGIKADCRRQVDERYEWTGGWTRTPIMERIGDADETPNERRAAR